MSQIIVNSNCPDDSNISPELSPCQITILIVDNSEVDRATYIRYLKTDTNSNYQFIEAKNLATGLEIWRSQHPDILLLEIDLPDGDGLEFLTAIAEDYNDEKLPAIVLTGKGDERVAVRAMKLGAADYLVKGDITAIFLCSCVEKVRDRTILTRQLIRSQQQESLIAEIALRIHQYLNLEDILVAIVQEVQKLLNTDRVVIFQFNSDLSGKIVAEAIVPPWTPSLHAEIRDTCFQENQGGAYREGWIFATPDIYLANLKDCHRELLERFQVRANLVVPILLPNTKDRILWGLLIVHHCSSPYNWNEMDIRLLQQLSVQLAIAIQQAELYQSLHSLNASLEQKIQELNFSENRFHGIFDNMFQFIGLVSPDGILLEVNQIALAVGGIKREDVVGRPFWEAYWWQSSVQTQEKLQNAIARAAKGEFIRYEVEWLGAEERLIPIDFSLRPLFDELEGVVMLIPEGRDISEAKRTESTLQFQAQILDQIHDGVFSTDLNGIIQTWNRGAEQLYGYQAAEIIGRSLSILYEEGIDLETMVIAPLLGNERYEIEIPTRSKSGNLLYVSLRLSVAWNEQENVTHLIGCSNDVSARKETERKIKQINQELEAKVQERTAELEDRKAELQKLSERLTLSLKSGAISTWEWDIEENKIFWDERMYELYGIRKQSDAVLPYDIWVNSLHPDDRNVSEALIQEAILGQAQFDTEFRVVHPDGSIHFIKAFGTVVKNTQGNPQSIIGVNFDITDRKQTELKLQQQAKQERLLSSVTQQMRSSLNLEEILNATVKELHQVLQSDRVMIYRLFPKGSGVAIAESVLPNWPKLLDIIFPKEVFPEENYERYLQGRVYALNDLEDANQSILPCLVNFLREIQVRAKLVVPIILNEVLWGLLIAHECDRPHLWEEWEINLLNQTANQLAIAIQQSSLFKQLKIELAERHLAEVRLKETNTRLAISNKELARATRLKDEFLANMSHELRTPLNSILGMTEGLQEEVFGIVNEEQIKALQTIDRSGCHLLELINDILDVAKIESGLMELDCALVSINQLCQSSLAFIKQQALKKRIQLDIKIEKNLPKLNVDERRIRQVLINLLNNAVKFTNEQGRITLDVSLLPPELTTPDASPQHFLRIAVIDTGIGISAENINKLFKPFIQIDSALNRQYVGSGLGLALVKQIVELHNGRVGLTSELGVGSCFTIDLPFVFDDSFSPEIMASKLTTTDELDATANSATVTKMPLILMAEDNEANISTVSSYLEAKGYRLVLAKHGQEAIELATSCQPDLILMDISMPGMDGLKAMQQIRLNPNLVDIPIIALTALAMTGDRDRCLEAGANDYLTKPVKLKQLAATIQQFLLPIKNNP
ncbi:hypothetical protein BCD67_16735 [Oscillatoriales cyanobacterium USR001]|nr:hypothetical protein BCD67_16735 [Oscillatoriales cyanobacterium USR001]